MSCQTVFASDIITPPALIDYLTGNGMFCVENPWFKPPGIPPVDIKKWLDLRPGSQNGIMLNSPMLYVKTPNGTFTRNFTIGLVNVVRDGGQIIKNPKTYWIGKPYKDSYKPNDPTISKYKLLVSPAPSDESDEILVKFNWQLCMVMDVLIVAKVTNLDLRKYEKASNKELFDGLVKDINGVLSQRGGVRPFAIEPAYVSSYDEAPCVSKDASKDIAVAGLNAPTEKLFDTFLEHFRVSVGNKGGWLPKHFQAIILKSDHSYAWPQISHKIYEKKGSEDAVDTEYADRVGYNLIFNFQNKASKLPASLVTLQQTTKGAVPLNPLLVATLWGEGPGTTMPSSSACQRGALFTQPSLGFRYYKSGHPGIEWRVMKSCVTRAPAGIAAVVDQGDEWIMGNGGDDTADFANGFTGGFVGNEPDIPMDDAMNADM